MRGQKIFCPSFMIIYEFNKKPAVSDKHDTAGFIISYFLVFTYASPTSA